MNLLLDPYVCSPDYWRSHLLKLSAPDNPIWKSNSHHLNWFEKVCRYSGGDYRYSTIIPFILKVGREIGEAYDNTPSKRDALLPYLEKQIHLLDYLKSEVIDVHNRRSMSKVDTTELDSLSKCLKRLLPPLFSVEKQKLALAIVDHYRLPFEILLKIVNAVPYSSLSTLARTCQAWNYFLKVYTYDIKALRWKTLFPLRSQVPPTLHFATASALNVDHYVVVSAGLGELLSTDAFGNLRPCGSTLKNSKAKALSSQHVVHYNKNDIQLYDVKYPKLLWNVSVEAYLPEMYYFSEYPEHFKVINDHQFIVMQFPKRGTTAFLKRLHICNTQTKKIHEIFFSPKQVNFFTYRNNTRCFIHTITRATIVNLSDLTKQTPNPLPPQPFSLQSHNDHFVVLGYFNPDWTYGVWSLSDGRRLVEFKRGEGFMFITPLDSKTLLISKFKDRVSSLVLFEVETQTEKDLGLRHSKELREAYQISPTIYLLKTEDFVNRNTTILAWNSATKALTEVDSTQMYTTFKVCKVKENLWVTFSRLTERLKFVEHEPLRDVARVTTYPLRVKDISIQDHLLLISHRTIPSQVILHL